MELIHANGKTLFKEKKTKLVLTNGLLLKWSGQLEQKRLSNDVDYYLQYDKIADLYSKYEKIIFDVNNQITALRKKYFEMDEKGNPVLEEITADNAKPKVKIKAGLVREGYMIELKELMSIEVIQR